MIIDTTQARTERKLDKPELKDVTLAFHLYLQSLGLRLIVAKNREEREWVRAFNAQWAQTMKDTYDYDPDVLAAGECDD